jgi:hypothetical protein
MYTLDEFTKAPCRLLSGLPRDHPEVAEEIPDIQEKLQFCERLCKEGQQRYLKGFLRGREQ